VSLFVRESGTAVLLILLTVLNAVIGLRQKGKAESAMNALKSMMKATRGSGATARRVRSRPSRS
jgi:P-type Ca2+ transporter type 2C